MNSVTMVGRLVRDPELRFTANSCKAVATCSIAVDRPFSKDKTADFFNFVVWGKSAENLANYMSKGGMVGIKGTLQSRTYEDKNGQKRYVVEIVADYVQFLSKGSGQSNTEQQTEYNTDEFQELEDDEDIPF